MMKNPFVDNKTLFSKLRVHVFLMSFTSKLKRNTATGIRINLLRIIVQYIIHYTTVITHKLLLKSWQIY